MARTCVLALGVAICIVDSVVVANEPAVQLLDRRNKTALHAVRSNVAIKKQALDAEYYMRLGAAQQQQAEQRAEYAVEAAVEMRFETVTTKLAGCAVKDFRSLADELYATADLLRKTAFDVEKRSVKLLALRVTRKPVDQHGFEAVGKLSGFGSGGMSKDIQATLKYVPDGSESFDDIEIHKKSPPIIEFHDAPQPPSTTSTTSVQIPAAVHSLSSTASEKVAAPQDSRTFRGAGNAKAPSVAVPVRGVRGYVHDADGNKGSPPPEKPASHSEGHSASKPSAGSPSQEKPGPIVHSTSKTSAVPLSYDDFTSPQATGGDDEALSVGAPVMPFGAESVGHELTARAGQAQDNLVDAMEAAEVAEIKRSIFRALTRLRSATIKEFDTIARLETQAIDAYNDAHNYRDENPLRHLHEDEAAPATDKLKSFH